ncbi:MAG TPA: hypothetical protein VEU76_00875 [Candidatus Udaeobacter sp.]|nr:hypothetical protein [Candidatus Udaeobacter sp.]
MSTKISVTIFLSSVSTTAVTGLPQFGQNLASLGSGIPQTVHGAITGLGLSFA